MKKFLILICLSLTTIFVNAQTPVPGKCTYVKVIPNQPHPIIVTCSYPIDKNCTTKKMCDFHCNRVEPTPVGYTKKKKK